MRQSKSEVNRTDEEMELAHRSAKRMMDIAGISKETGRKPPRKMMLTESGILLRRAWGLWWRLRWPWRRRGQ